MSLLLLDTSLSYIHPRCKSHPHWPITHSCLLTFTHTRNPYPHRPVTPSCLLTFTQTRNPYPHRPVTPQQSQRCSQARAYAELQELELKPPAKLLQSGLCNKGLLYAKQQGLAIEYLQYVFEAGWPNGFRNWNMECVEAVTLSGIMVCIERLVKG